MIESTGRPGDHLDGPRDEAADHACADPHGRGESWDAALQALLGHFPVEDLASCGPAMLLDVVVATQRSIDALQAVHAVAVAGFTQARLVESHDILEDLMSRGDKESDAKIPEWDGSAELGLALGLSRGAVTRLTHSANRLLLLPQTLSALAAGRLHWPAVTAIVQETSQVDGSDKLARIEDDVYAPLHADQRLRLTPAQLGRRARHAVHAIDPDAVRRRRQAAADDRTVWIQPLADGMARLNAQGPAEVIQAMYRAITRLADHLTWRPKNTSSSDDGGGRDPQHADTGVSGGTGDAGHRGADSDARDEADTDPDVRPEPKLCGTGRTIGGDAADAHVATSADNDAAVTGAHQPATSVDGAQATQPGPGRGWLAALAGTRLPDWFGQVHDPRHRFSAGRARFDTLRLLVEAALADSDGMLLTHHRGSAPTTAVNVTIPLDALLGLRDDPAHLPGYGPLPAAVARMLATDAVLHRIITDPATGATLETSTTAYRATPAMRRLLFAMHETCTFPGCTVPTDRCDIDHADPWPRGDTSIRNQHPLCRHHHMIKTHQPGWHVHRDTNTSRMEWTSPTGHTGCTYPGGYKFTRQQPADQNDPSDPTHMRPTTADRTPGDAFDPDTEGRDARLGKILQAKRGSTAQTDTEGQPPDPLANYPDDPPF